MATNNAMSEAGIKVRAVTRFVVLSSDQATWKEHLAAAAQLCGRLATTYNTMGYQVQTLRIVTNPFGEYLDTSSEEAVLLGLGMLKSILAEVAIPGIRIRCAVGAAMTSAELQLVPAMIRDYGDLANICVNIGADEYGVVDAAMVDDAAAVTEALSKCTPRGEGNFNFTVNFACGPLIPYFPAGYNTAESGESFAIGLEHPKLMHQVLQPLQLHTVSPQNRAAAWAQAHDALVAACDVHVAPLVQAAEQEATASGIRFAGLDSSAAPSKDTTSICQLFECLGVPHFGASGTIEAAAFLTRVFKAIKGCDLVGFSGLMLTCLEDEGMAAAAAAGYYDIRALLQYSCVCGIGLDCVPIPGNTSKSKIGALMRDTATLALRYNKPLTVRLFPCEGLNAGEMTGFESDDLCNCTVFKVD